MTTITENRLMSFYDQLPASKRQPYGRIINAYRAGQTQEAAESARQWFDNARHQSEINGNAFWQFDYGAAGCLLNILTGIAIN
jgi:hypothetical protein